MSAKSSPAPLRVVMVTARADSGGGPEHIYQLAKALAAQVEVWIACPRDEPYWDRYAALLTPSRLLEIPHRAFRVGAFARLVKWIRSERFQLIHAHGLMGGFYGRLASMLTGVPCCHTPNGVTPARSLFSRAKALVEYLLSGVTAMSIAVSESEAEALRGRSFRPASIEVIPNGVELSPVQVAPDAAGSAPWRVIHITRFVYQKNFELLLSILEELRRAGQLEKFHFVVLGDGPERARYEAAAAAAGFGSFLTFRGAVPNVREECLHAAAVISSSRWEGLPLALLEGMSVGLPVIATDVIGNRDAVEDQRTGFLFDLDQPAQAAARLVELAPGSERWTEMSAAARQRVAAHFSNSQMAARTAALYHQILDRPARPQQVGVSSQSPS